MSDTLPCPFCGNNPKVFDTNIGWQIDCVSDACVSEPRLKDGYHRKEDAISAWNTRFQSPDTITIPRDEYEELKRDAERLDHLIKTEEFIWEVNGRYSVHELSPGGHRHVTVEFMTAREAIDAAMSKVEQEPDRIDEGDDAWYNDPEMGAR